MVVINGPSDGAGRPVLRALSVRPGLIKAALCEADIHIHCLCMPGKTPERPGQRLEACRRAISLHDMMTLMYILTSPRPHSGRPPLFPWRSLPGASAFLCSYRACEPTLHTLVWGSTSFSTVDSHGYGTWERPYGNKPIFLAH